ncbi:MAG TPA: hypothetical protein VFP92_12760 [Rhodanobacteraceae bacterium]|nr:hypothetical protein [Rhodanobacteraceae bacterium]
MRARYLGLLALMVASPLFAATNWHQFNLRLCHNTRHGVHAMWLHNMYATTPAISRAMLFAVNGDTAKLRGALAAMPPKAAQQWRQSALGYAALEGHADTVEALLDDGARADAWNSEPALKPEFFKQVLNVAAHNPHLGGAKGVAALQKTGLVDNKPRRVGPAIYGAIQCDDITTVKVLLRHHVNPMQQARPHGADPFSNAVLAGHADITRLFLEHGASPCVEDQRIAANWKRGHRKAPANTIANIGKHAGLPAGLVQRLGCHAPPAAS